MAKSEPIKFTEDEVKSLQDLSTDYQQVFSDIGKNRINKLRLQKEIENQEQIELELETRFTALQETEQKLVKEFNDKYGDGELNPTTGVFKPNS